MRTKTPTIKAALLSIAFMLVSLNVFSQEIIPGGNNGGYADNDIPSKYSSFTFDGLTYKVTDGYRSVEVTESAGDEYSGNITIPSTVTIDNYIYNVVGIGGNAFMNCENLTSITLNEGITYIGDMSFDSCKKLASINLPNTVTVLQRSAFRDCSSLTSITLPKVFDHNRQLCFLGCRFEVYKRRKREPSI